MALDNFKGGKKDLSWVPDVFDPKFELPDSPFVVFTFKDQGEMRFIKDTFTDEHRGVVIFVDEKKKRIYTTRQGKDTARLMLELVQECKEHGEIEGGVNVTGDSQVR